MRLLSVFFSGDSGYSSDFAKIGAAYGPFDATLIKIGAYGPGKFWQDVHMTPEEAMQTHLDLGGKVMVPVHWATFNLALSEQTSLNRAGRLYSVF